MSFRSILAIGMLGGSLLLTGCAEDEKLGPEDVAEGEVPPGAEVTITGEVDKVYDERTFKLEDPDELISRDLVVVSRESLPAGVREGAKVKVTGMVKTISDVEIEREVEWDFDQEVEIELEGVKSYLVAESVEVVQRTDKIDDANRTDKTEADKTEE